MKHKRIHHDSDFESNRDHESEKSVPFTILVIDIVKGAFIVFYILMAAGIGKVFMSYYSEYYILSRHYSEAEIRENNLHFVSPYSSLNVSNGDKLPDVESLLLSTLNILGMFAGLFVAILIFHLIDKYFFGSKAVLAIAELYNRYSSNQSFEKA